jgi:peroxiredoxin
MPPIESLLKPGTPAPPFRLPDTAGQIHDLAALTAAGQKVLLFFFRGTW